MFSPIYHPVRNSAVLTERIKFPPCTNIALIRVVPEQESCATSTISGSIPTFIHISDGKLHDVNVLDLLLIEAGAFYIMDRGYLDFERLYALDQVGGFFITRAKRNLDARRVHSAPVDRDTGLICDQTIALNGFYAAKRYPAYLRRIRYRDPETGKNLVFLTNQFALPALTICALYRCRWQVELFFKWIKQHLRMTFISDRHMNSRGIERSQLRQQTLFAPPQWSKRKRFVTPVTCPQCVLVVGREIKVEI